MRWRSSAARGSVKACRSFTCILVSRQKIAIAGAVTTATAITMIGASGWDSAYTIRLTPRLVASAIGVTPFPYCAACARRVLHSPLPWIFPLWLPRQSAAPYSTLKPAALQSSSEFSNEHLQYRQSKCRIACQVRGLHRAALQRMLELWSWGAIRACLCLASVFLAIHRAVRFKC